MSIELNCKDGYNIEIEKKEDRINILLVENEAFGERILVGAEERKEFLTPWINMLMHHKKEAGNQRNDGSGKETGAHRTL